VVVVGLLVSGCVQPLQVDQSIPTLWVGKGAWQNAQLERQLGRYVENGVPEPTARPAVFTTSPGSWTTWGSMPPTEPGSLPVPALPTPATETFTPAPDISDATTNPGDKVTVSGTIYNEKGETVDGATVTVRSLDASLPFSAIVQSTRGAYAVMYVPRDANVEVVVSKYGWTSRRRVVAVQNPTERRATLDFGGREEPAGAAYFISDYPEVVATQLSSDDNGTGLSALRVKVTLHG
jgi:hypothetical protein